MTNMMITKQINDKLSNTHHPIEMIEQQYVDDLNIFDIKLKKYIKHILSLDDYYKNIMLLFMEYGSYRKVAEETNVSHVTMTKDIKKIKNELLCI